MSPLLRISYAASIGIHALIWMDSETRKVFPASWLASELGVSQNHLIKILQRLSNAELLRAVRGPKGGYVLALPSANVTLRQVLEILEGRLKPGGCLLRQPVCGGPCLLGEVLETVSKQLMPFLNETTIADLSKQMKQRQAQGLSTVNLSVAQDERRAAGDR